MHFSLNLQGCNFSIMLHISDFFKHYPSSVCSLSVATLYCAAPACFRDWMRAPVDCVCLHPLIQSSVCVVDS